MDSVVLNNMYGDEEITIYYIQITIIIEKSVNALWREMIKWSRNEEEIKIVLMMYTMCVSVQLRCFYLRRRAAEPYLPGE